MTAPQIVIIYLLLIGVLFLFGMNLIHILYTNRKWKLDEGHYVAYFMCCVLVFPALIVILRAIIEVLFIHESYNSWKSRHKRLLIAKRSNDNV